MIEGSVSIDGKIHEGYLKVKYGQPFPETNNSIWLHNKDYGNILVYVVEVGQPEWTKKMSVRIPFRYYITDIFDPEKEYIKQVKKPQLRVVK